MITVNVKIGMGSWSRYKTITLVACPHVGDGIEVGESVMIVDAVIIGPDKVTVRSKGYIHSEEQADEYTKMGWEA